MKIKELEMIHAEVPMKNTRFHVSQGILGKGERVLIKITTESGVEGWGDSGQITTFYSGETSGSILSFYDWILPIVSDLEVYELGKLHEIFEKVPGNNQAKCALDLAFHDALTRTLEIPLHKFFGGALVSQVETQLDISMGSLEHTKSEISDAMDLGIKCVGIKVGRGVGNDVDIVKFVRKEFGPSLEIWIDANGAYTPDQAIELLNQIKQYDIGYAEQPIPRGDLAGMARVAATSGVPIMADESVWSARDVVEIAERRSASALHIKLQKGGLYGCRVIANVAETVGLPITLANLVMTEMGAAATVQFIAANRIALQLPNKLRGHLFLDDDIVKNVLEFKDGCFFVPKGLGFGLDVDESKLSKFVKHRKKYDRTLAGRNAVI